MADRSKICGECGKTFRSHETIKSGLVAKVLIFDNPWDKVGEMIKVHTANEDKFGRTCQDKLTDTGRADFRYFECAECHRMVIRQCPKNGWRSYVKHRGDEEICVACYQKTRLENGESREVLESGRIPGDFHNHSELQANGWLPVLNHRCVHITSSERAKEFCQAALELLDKGKRVLVDYDSMAIGGGEGYISLYCKEGANDAEKGA